MSRLIGFYTDENGKVRPLTQSTSRTAKRTMQRMRYAAQQAALTAFMKQPEPEPQQQYSSLYYIKDAELGREAAFEFAPSVPERFHRHIIDSYFRLPSAARKLINRIHVQDTPYRFKIGETEFEAAASWNSSQHTLSIYASSLQKPEALEGTIAHEAGHALYGHLIEKAASERTDDTYVQRYDQINDEYHRNVNDIMAKYAPIQKKFWDELDELRESWLAGKIDDATYHKRRKQIHAKSQAQHKKMLAEIDAEKEKKRMKIEALKLEYMPTGTKLRRFEDASENEKGLTSYSAAWLQQDTYRGYDENFAEAMKIWYSNKYALQNAVEWAKQFPKTYRAFMDLIAGEFAGHSVPIKLKPQVPQP